MKDSRTNDIGVRTGRLTKTAIANKSENHDYCFKRREDAEAGNITQEGWEVVQGVGVKETWQNKYAQKIQQRTRGEKQLPLVDTILCRREKDATEYFEEYHNDKRRAQARLIKEATNNNRNALKNLDPDAKLRNDTAFTGANSELFNQKTGPNMEGGNDGES